MPDPDMSPAAVVARLRQVAAWWQASRRPPADMSPEAVGRRLQTVAELNRLCSWLQSAGRQARDQRK